MNALVASQLCEFVTEKPGRVRCKHCAKTLDTDAHPSGLRMACKRRRPTPPTVASEPPFKLLTVDELPCAHRGDVTRQEHCKLLVCKGGTLFDVYRCHHFGDECSLQNRAVPGLRVCKKCHAREGALVELAPVTRSPAIAKPRTGPIRVAFLTPTLGLGGAERWILSLCAAWADRTAVDVQAIALTSGAQSWEPFCVEAERHGVAVLADRTFHDTQPNATRSITRLASATAALRAAVESVDVVVHWGIPNVRELFALAGYAGRSVSVSHGSGDWTLQMTTQAATGSTHFAAVSRPSRDAQPPAVRDRTKILWNGIDPDRVVAQVPREETRAAWGLEPDDIALGYVGRLSDEKNPMAIADAWRGLGGTHAGRRVVPVWVGDGWLAAKYHRLIAEQVGEAGRVIPATNEIGSVLAALDVYCLASPGEGFSLGLMEAWAAGIPAVSTPVGAVPELEEQFGAMTFRVPVAGTPAEMAAGVRAAIEAGRGSEIVDRAERVTREHLSLRAMGQRWRDWFEEFV